jgi:hypothetical protein
MKLVIAAKGSIGNLVGKLLSRQFQPFPKHKKAVNPHSGRMKAGGVWVSP